MMSEAVSGKVRPICLGGSILAILALGACSDGENLAFLQPKTESIEVARNETSTTKLVERDVEAPEVFSATEAGLWDGRPSLGGVWVAHPDVTEPERVIIRNTTNNKFVIGALFRRERDIPGPRLQASSDAAAALGMLAGAPVQLNVTALRREEVTPEPEVSAAIPDDMPVAQGDTLGNDAETAINASGDQPEASPVASDDVLDTVESASTKSTAPRKSWFGASLFGKRDKDMGEPLNALNPQPVNAAASAVETKPLTSPAPAPQNSSLEKPYVQIGIFSVEANAKNTADQMRRAGIVPTVFEQSTNGKEFWRVVVGPAQSSSERAALLTKIKGIGFSDAYAVTN